MVRIIDNLTNIFGTSNNTVVIFIGIFFLRIGDVQLSLKIFIFTSFVKTLVKNEKQMNYAFEGTSLCTMDHFIFLNFLFF